MASSDIATTAPLTTPVQDALRAAGPQALHILGLSWLTLAVCVLVFVAILGALLYALRPTARADSSTAPDTASLQRHEPAVRRWVMAAVGICALLLIVLMGASVLTDRALAQLDTKDALRIEVTGHQWWWEARYEAAPGFPAFVTANEFHIPVGRAVVITLKSEDVIHSFWVPNLHGKKDMIPGHTATIHLRADQVGIYRGQCAEFCGMQHAFMALLIVAEPAEQFEAWAARQGRSAVKPSEGEALRGHEVFMNAACATCHTIEGTQAQARKAPDLTHLASRQTLAAGMLPNTRGHLAGWIADPQKIKPGVNMPPAALPSQDLMALLAYLETLK